MRKVQMQLTQPHHDADGNVLHQPGARFDEGDKVLDGLPPGSFKPVIVETDPDVDPFPEHNTPEQPQRVTQPGPEGDGDQVADDPKKPATQPAAKASGRQASAKS